MFYLCPLCNKSLNKVSKSFRCENNHSFDVAKEGYVNLLPVQKKSSKDPGDNKEMMQARREFLNAGFYQHLSTRLNQLVKKFHLPEGALLDLGCGEGYYTGRVEQTLIDTQMFGLDISKTAIRYASKRYPNIQFCVASAFDSPFADQFFDTVIRVYAPSKLEELQRIIKKKGYLITVSPGEKHHWMLKTLIYANPKLGSNDEQTLDGFELIHSENLSSDMELSNEADIGNFLNMTPYAWKFTESQKKQLCLNGLICELDFKIQVHKRI